MAKYRKKPVVVEAMQYTQKNRPCIIKWVPNIVHVGIDDDGAAYELANIRIPTLEGDMLASIGDWVIKGVKGEFYPCKPDIFDATYDKC